MWKGECISVVLSARKSALLLEFILQSNDLRVGETTRFGDMDGVLDSYLKPMRKARQLAASSDSSLALANVHNDHRPA